VEDVAAAAGWYREGSDVSARIARTNVLMFLMFLLADVFTPLRFYVFILRRMKGNQETVLGSLALKLHFTPVI
jgi:hypothetical protein